MNVIDWLLIGATVVLAWSGWRQGLVAGVAAFAGFILGGIAGVAAVPWVVDSVGLGGVARTITVASGVLVCALVGQSLASYAGRRVRALITWEPARIADSVAGSGFQVLALVIVTWIIASTLTVLPATSLTSSVRQSAVLAEIDRIVPDTARDAMRGLRDAVGESGLPRAFAGIAEILGPEVAPPDPALLRNPAVRRAWNSLVRVSGSADSCGTEVTGSGFVYSPERVLTNAHVVAGVDQPVVQVRGDGPALPARVVAFDPRIDLAVLLVPGLTGQGLAFAASPAESGDAAVVAGFPGGGSLTAGAARIRAEISARGEDVYGRSGVTREVYSFRGEVRPGNSGGPLLSPSGRVYGVVFASALNDPSTGYAITADQASDLAAEGIAGRIAVDTGPCSTS